MEDMLQYLDEMVEPTIRELEAEPTSRRRAFLACVATYHALDYLALPKKKTKAIRQKLRDASPDFVLVDRIAHAFKHVETKDPHIPKLSAASIVRRPPAPIGEFAFGLSRFGDPVGGVTVFHETEIDVLDTVKRATAFLRTWKG